jgi:hypothetical protein
MDIDRCQQTQIVYGSLDGGPSEDFLRKESSRDPDERPMRTRRYFRRAHPRSSGISRYPLTKFSRAELERRSAFFDACDAAYAEMQSNPVLWEQELAERRLWDGTLLDGLQEG